MKSILVGLNCISALGLFALTTSAQTMTALGNLPLYFEVNHGQTAGPEQFVARGHDYQFLISPTEAQIMLHKTAAEPATVRMQFVGANTQAQISGDTALPGKINYLIGNDPAQWHTGVATFAKVRVGELYHGVNLVYYGNQQQLEYDFIVAPGANPGAIVIHFAGADKISVNARGELILSLAGGEIRQPKPVIYQTIGGTRKEIEGGYRIAGARTIAFAVGQYDHNQPLVIDPVLSYSTYFGGNYGETAWSVAINTNDGSIYMAGQTFSTQFTNRPVPPGAYQTNYHGGTYAGDAFVARFSNLGTNLIYFTYLGGSGDDAAYGLAVDGAGNAYVTGWTDSTDFPTKNAIPGYTNISGKLDTHVNPPLYPADVFVAKLDSSGSNLVYSTYLGGNSSDAAYGIAVDSSDNAYITGFTYSTNFPTTTNAFQKHIGVANWAYQAYYNANAFVTEIASNGTSLVFSTYFGGTNYDLGKSITVNASGIYVTGFTASTNFPNTNAFRRYLSGSTNAFVAKFDPTGTNLVYSTFLGGVNSDVANSIAVDSLGNAYVVGCTTSTDFTNTVTGITNLYNGLTNNLYGYAPVVTNAFLTQITWNGTNSAIGYSVVFGGTNAGIDIGYGVAVDPTGNAFVVGTTSSADFPTFNTSGLLGATNSGGNDVFITAFSTNASALLYSAYLGGLSDDFGYGIAVDPAGNAYIVGQTTSANFPTLNAFQSARNGVNDAFLAKIFLASRPILTITAPNTNDVALAWRAFQPEYTLTSNTNLTSTNWPIVTNPPVLINGWHTVTLPATNDDSFFRLQKF